jgi:hypothetical protein
LYNARDVSRSGASTLAPIHRLASDEDKGFAMNIRNSIVSVSFAILAAAPGLAEACSQQDALAREAHLSHLIEVKTAQDATRGPALAAKAQPARDAFQARMASQGQAGSGPAADWSAVCSQYDALIGQISTPGR